MKTDGLLIPVDFSTGSLDALDFALAIIEPEGELYLLHVVDIDFVERLSEEGFGTVEQATAQLRQRAEARLQEIVQARLTPTGPRLESMVVIGKPFAEILRIASDLDFGMIVLGIQGRHQGDIESLLFGSTAEKVLRAARIPVLCVPARAALRRVVAQSETSGEARRPVEEGETAESYLPDLGAGL
jgi:nucleotide-binding universal stress UspA family protein